jgi:hypothetical protein
MHTAVVVAWAIALGLGLLFTTIKVRNWGAALDAPEQSDFAVYYAAAQIVHVAPEALYRTEKWAELLQSSDAPGMPFPYAPMIAAVLRPIGTLPYEFARRIWFWSSVFLELVTLWLLLRRSSGRLRLSTGLMFLFFPAVLDVLHLGQINAWIGLLTVGAWLGCDDRRPGVRFLAGMLLGVACCMKPIVAGLALLALVRRQWGYLGGMTAGAVLVLLFGMIALPIPVTGEYFGLLIGYTRALTPPGIEQYLFWNQSIWAFWKKLLGDSDALGRVLGFATAAGVVLAAAVRLWRRNTPTAVEAAAALLAVLIASPVVWNHYLLAIAPVFVGAAAAASQHRAWYWGMALPLGYALMVAQRASEPLMALTGISISTSLMTFGMLLWLAALLTTPAAAQDAAAAPGA